MKEKSLAVIKKESIFTKIKRFLQKMFQKEKQEVIQEINYEGASKVEDSKDKFKENIKFDTKEELKKLQHLLKTKEMKISELTEKQKDNLIELYNEQIKMKKEKLLGLYKKIEKLKKVEENI